VQSKGKVDRISLALQATWITLFVSSVAERVKAPFLRRPCGHNVWSKFNSHPHRTRCCVLG